MHEVEQNLCMQIKQNTVYIEWLIWGYNYVLFCQNIRIVGFKLAEILEMIDRAITRRKIHNWKMVGNIITLIHFCTTDNSRNYETACESDWLRVGHVIRFLSFKPHILLLTSDNNCSRRYCMTIEIYTCRLHVVDDNYCGVQPSDKYQATQRKCLWFM